VTHWTHPQALDRCEEHRGDPAWIAAAWLRTDARLLGVDAAGGVNADGTGLVLTATDGAYDDTRHFFLGLWDGAPLFTTAVEEASTMLRAAGDKLTPAALEAAFTAVGLIGWHSRAGFCPVCGAATAPVLGGLARRCDACGVEDYPRSDPAVIMAVVDGADRLLLGRQPSWPTGRYSVLAGFAEVGESLEQAVHREVGEEAGIKVRDVTYLGSQAWPFPRSLMVAFTARAVTTQLRPAPGEIEDARWLTRDELREQIADQQISLPMSISIARRMIDAWLDDELLGRVG
jgi:NAD+ diphosphatase